MISFIKNSKLFIFVVVLQLWGTISYSSAWEKTVGHVLACNVLACDSARGKSRLKISKVPLSLKVNARADRLGEMSNMHEMNSKLSNYTSLIVA